MYCKTPSTATRNTKTEYYWKSTTLRDHLAHLRTPLGPSVLSFRYATRTSRKTARTGLKKATSMIEHLPMPSTTSGTTSRNPPSSPYPTIPLVKTENNWFINLNSLSPNIVLYDYDSLVNTTTLDKCVTLPDLLMIQHKERLWWVRLQLSHLLMRKESNSKAPWVPSTPGNTWSSMNVCIREFHYVATSYPVQERRHPTWVGGQAHETTALHAV